MKNRMPLTLLASALVLVGCGSSPSQLAKDVEATLAQGDPDALLAHVDLRGVPGDAIFFVADLALECSSTYRCSATVLDDPKAVEEHAGKPGEGTAFRVAPEGILHIAGREADAKPDEKPTMNVHVPYAKVDGEYRLLTAGYTAEKIESLRATTPAAAADEILALGVYDDTLGARDLGWKEKATPLPADGGAPGAAFTASVEALGKALASGSVQAVADAKGDWGRAVFASTDYEGKPVAEDLLKRKVRAQSYRFVTEAKVLGGYEKDGFAVLVIEGRNGRGDLVRGAQFMKLEDGTWREAGNETIAIPTAL